MEINITIDGACNAERKCGCGAIVEIGNDRKVALGRYLGEGTNNQAEYGALIMALDWLIVNGHQSNDIKINSDSQLLVNQVNRFWSVNNIPLMELNQQVVCMMKHFPTIAVGWIRRELNKEADKVSKQFAKGGDEFITVVREVNLARV